jgi:O-Antigen ligase
VTALLIVSIWVAVGLLYARFPRASFAAYSVVLAAFPFYWAPLSIPPFNAMTIQRTFAVGLALGFALQTLREMHNRILNTRKLVAEFSILAFVVLWSISGFQDRTFSAGVRGMTFNVLDFWVPYALGIEILTRTRDLKYLFTWLVWPAVGVAVVTLYEYSVQAPVMWDWFNSIYSVPAADIWSPALRAGQLRVQATLGQPIFLGFYLTSAGLFALVLAEVGSPKRRWFYYLLGGFIIFCSLLPLARGATIALVICGGLLVLLPGFRGRRVVLATASAGVILLFGSATLLENTMNYWADFALTLVGRAPIYVQAQQLQNMEYRTNTVQEGIQIISEGPPLGYGDVSVNGTWPIADVANVFVEVGLVSGPIGLVALFIFLVAVSIQLAALWRRERNSTQNIFASAFIVGFVLVLLAWADSSWPGQFTQVGWLVMGAIAGWSGLKATAVPQQEAWWPSRI